MPCQLEVNLSGEALDAFGVPTELLAWGRVLSGQCNRVEVTVRVGQGGVIVASGQVAPDSNGTWSFRFSPPLIPWPCGSHLWVEARCVAGGNCSTARSVGIACKTPNDQPGGPGPGGPGHGGPGDDDPNGGGPDWPWPLPPHIWCPMVGQTFITALVAALGIILTGSAVNNLAVVTSGIAMVGAAFVALAFWRRWCAPNWCYVLGAIFWVLGRATLAGIVLTIATRSVLTGVWTLGFGALAGMFNIALLRRRCRVPSLATPLSQLPLW